MTRLDYAGKMLPANLAYNWREKNLPKCFVKQSPLLVAFSGNPSFYKKAMAI